MNHSILYRGPLVSCNYGCSYCPFAKRRQSQPELAEDRAALRRFLSWCEAEPPRHGSELSVLFTPWGEALIRPWYRDALARLTQLPHVRRAAIQTNISCHLKWLDACNVGKLGLWCTYHPSETTRERFLARCRELDQYGVRYSVGIVGLKEHLTDAQWLRDQLSDNIYLWVNAYKRTGNYYTPAEADRFTVIDPLFPINNQQHASLDRPCRSGSEVFTVDGDGAMRRCHFVKGIIGNIYQENWQEALQPATCSAATCGCHIGYVHMPDLQLYEVFGAGLLERVPAMPIWRRTSRPALASPRVISLPQVSASGR